jgi:hypothetical protein
MYKVPPTFPLSSTVPIGLTNAKFDDNIDTNEKQLYNSAKEKKKTLTVDLSLSEAQEKSLAWTKDKSKVSRLVKPPEVDINHTSDPSADHRPNAVPSADPDPNDDIRHDLLQKYDKYAAADLSCFLIVAKKWLESETYKPLAMLSFQVMDILLHLRATNPEVYDIMESRASNRHLAEGQRTWDVRFENEEFCNIFLKICKDVGLSMIHIQTLMEAMLPGVKSLGSFCRYGYTIMLLWGFHRDDLIQARCLFGKLRLIMNNALEKYTYKKFQSARRNVVQEGTDQDNNTHQVCQDSINHILSSGSFNFMVRGKSKTIYFGPTLL